jgi:hypothetical protein
MSDEMKTYGNKVLDELAQMLRAGFGAIPAPAALMSA